MPAGIKGRSVQVRWNGTPLAGVRTKSISMAGSSIDITTDDDSGIQQILDDVAQVGVTVKVAGVAKAETLRSLSVTATSRGALLDFVYGGFDGSPANTHGFSGRFVMTSYQESGEYKDVVTFEAEFQSNGAITYVAK